MNKLEMLDIKETNIDRGWKYLPKNLEFFYHSLEGKNKDSAEKQLFNNQSGHEKYLKEKIEKLEKELSALNDNAAELNKKERISSPESEILRESIINKFIQKVAEITKLEKQLGDLQEKEYEEQESQNQPFSFENLPTCQDDWSTHGNPFLDFAKKTTWEWMSRKFSKEQTKEWLNTGLQAQDYEYVQWLRDIKGYTPEKLLNEGNEQQLRNEYQDYQQLQANIEILPK